MKMHGFVFRIGEKFISIAESMEARTSGLGHNAYRDCFFTIRRLIRLHRPVNVCDVGANEGHWSLILSSLCSSIRHITLFEPQPELNQSLQKLTIPGVKTACFPIALGEFREKGVLHSNTASASLLVPGEAQHRLFPGSIEHVDQRVSVDTLDNIYADNDLPIPDLIKIDVQGGELAVLKGATRLLRQARVVVAEISFQTFYQGQPACWELLRFLQEQNFVLADWGYAWRASAAPHEVLQADGIFVQPAPIRAEN